MSLAIATDLCAALDPVTFARRVGLAPDLWQADVLRSDASRLLRNCARQYSVRLPGSHVRIPW